MNPHRNFEEFISLHFQGGVVRDACSMTGGVSADTMLLDIELPNGGSSKIVLREHGHQHSGHEAALEFQLLERLHSLGVTVPKPVGYSSGSSAEQNPYVLLEYVEGTTDLGMSVAKERIKTAAEKLVSIHGVNTDTLPKLPPRFDPLPELLDFLPEDTEWNELRSHLAEMEATAFTGKGALLHGDYWPANIVWKEGEIAAVIDWEDAAIGDPLSDVACACLELRYIFGNWGSQCFLRAYSAKRHVDARRLALWQAYVAAAGNRFMGGWGLDPARVERMRKVALASIAEAGLIFANSNTTSG